MNIVEALNAADYYGVYCRPVGSSYRYHYVRNGSGQRVQVANRDRRNRWRNATCMVMLRPEMEAKWELCDMDGGPFDPDRMMRVGPCLADLL